MAAWGEVGLEEAVDCCEKKACLGGGPFAREGSFGRSTLSAEKSRPGGMTLMSGIVRPTLRLVRSTRSSFTSYLQQQHPNSSEQYSRKLLIAV